MVSLRKRVWGWYFFDWASQPYHTLIITFVFGPYFAAVLANKYVTMGRTNEVAEAAAQSMWSLCLTVSGLIIAFGAPLIGAMADASGRKTIWVACFSVMVVVGATGLWYLTPDGDTIWTVLICFGIGFIGIEYALIFINSQLPSLGTPEEVGRISGSGFAFGYFGGLVSLILMLALFVEQPDGKTLVGFNPAFGLDPTMREGTRIVGPLTALWYMVFMIPYFMWVPSHTPAKGRISISAAFASLKRSIRNLKHRKSLSFYLVSSMLYRDALNGLYSFGGVYAKLVLHWKIVSVGIFGIVGAIAAVIFSYVGGRLDSRYGPRPVIITSILGLTIVCAVVVGMSRKDFYGVPIPEGSKIPDIVFFCCGALIGGFGGVLQASSRSLMSRHTDPSAPTESFGLYGLCGRATAFLAPGLIGIVTSFSESARMGFTPVLFLFLVALFLIRWVQPEGDRETWTVK